MPCCGKHLESRKAAVPVAGPKAIDAPRTERTIVPYEQCIFCAEKHVSDAWDLCREWGYEFPNRQTIIGALGSAERHVMVLWKPLAEMIRAARHLVQQREESKIDWTPLLKEVDRLATDAANDLKIQALNQKREK
jgi:hypothetical protein